MAAVDCGTGTAVGGLTAFSLLGIGGLLALPLFALPAILGGVPVSPGLFHTALLGIAAFQAGEAACRYHLLVSDSAGR
jgi:hypothetical protein